MKRGFGLAAVLALPFLMMLRSEILDLQEPIKQLNYTGLV